MATARDDELPFWCVNVPPEQRPAECPEFLRDISEKDRLIIGSPDESYTLLTWGEVRELVSTTGRPRGGGLVLTRDRNQPRGQVSPQTVRAAAVQAVHVPAGPGLWQHYGVYCERAVEVGEHGGAGQAV